MHTQTTNQKKGITSLEYVQWNPGEQSAQTAGS